MKLFVVHFFLAASMPWASSAGPLIDLAVNAVNGVVAYFASDAGKEGNLAETVCDAAFTILDIDGLDCTCSINLVDDANSALGSMECNVAEGCLDEKDIFCGKGDVSGSIEAGENGIGLTMLSCVYVDLNLLPDDDLLTNSTIDPFDLCVDASSEPGSWGFDQCSASFNGELCNCTVCGSFGVEFDCKAIGGPKLPLCSSLDFLSSLLMNDGDDSVQVDDFVVSIDDFITIDDNLVFPIDDTDAVKVGKGAKGDKGEKMEKSEKNAKDDDDE